MAIVFISYRREDTEATAGRIYDALEPHIGKDSVFMDVETIPPGIDFRKYINDAVSQCDAFLALIGSKWLRVRKIGRRRLEDPNDFVRIEIEAALKRDIPVIP